MSITRPASPRSEVGLLLLAGIATVIFWHLPFGNFFLYPFTILATWFHEMGHGLGALLLGGNFEQLAIYSNGAGIAVHSGRLYFGPFGRAFVSAAGPLGPAFAGSLLIFSSQSKHFTRSALFLLGSAILLSTLVWVRSVFGLLILPLIGAGILYIAIKSSNRLQAFAVQFLGVQACISTYKQIDYLYTKSVIINGREMLSDSGQIAQALLLPYWFWGSLMAILSLALLVSSLWWTHRY